MTTPFATAQTRVNAAAMAQLSDSIATIGAASFPVIFSNGYAESLNFIGGSSPQIKCAASDVSSVVEGTAVTVNAINYTVAEIHPDGSGITVLKLEAV